MINYNINKILYLININKLMFFKCILELNLSYKLLQILSLEVISRSYINFYRSY